MKRLVILLIVFVDIFSTTQISNANIGSNVKDGVKPEIQEENILSVQVNSTSGKTRLFKITDGYEEKAIRKVTEWINDSNIVKGSLEVPQSNSTVMMIKMRNGEEAFIKPAYNCSFKKQTKICTTADGEVIYTQNNIKIRLKSSKLFDWLLVGWKHEPYGASKDELLEETLYTRYYLSHLGRAYDDFFMCPKIDKIERINGDSRGHLVYASALSYSGHHEGYYDKINILLKDNRNGVQIEKIVKHKNLSATEVEEQCKRY